MNWRGRPLTSYEVVVELIGATTTREGLRVHAELDRGRYPTSVKVPDHELAAVPLTEHDFHGERNYSVAPTRTSVGIAMIGSPRAPTGRVSQGASRLSAGLVYPNLDLESVMSGVADRG